MTIQLFHHPFSRAASVVWMLEEVGVPYTLRFVDLKQGDQKHTDVTDLNKMGKLPVLVDGEVVVSEAAAIGLYLADRYAPGRLAPALDAKERGAYLRWSLFSPSVIEPSTLAHAASWPVNARSAGFGTYEEMLATLEQALTPGPWLLGDDFSMADVILGSTVRWLLGFKMLPPQPALVAYTKRLAARPALARADAKNAQVREERGLAG